MFSMTDLMGPFGRQESCHTAPIFVDLRAQPNYCNRRRCPSNLSQGKHASNRREIPDFASFGRTYSPLAETLQHIFEDRADCKCQTNAQGIQKEQCCETTQKKPTPQRKRESDNPTKETKDGESRESRPNFEDILKQTLSALTGWTDVQNDDTWKHRVDCRGFGSNDIKVKIDSQNLLLKAYREHESENGIRTMTMKKSVPLPDNIEAKGIKCKLLPNGFMVIEAPYLVHDKQEKTLEFVSDVMKTMIPGLEKLLRPSDYDGETVTKENCSDSLVDNGEKPYDCQEGTKTNEEETEQPKVDGTNQIPVENNLEEEVTTLDTNGERMVVGKNNNGKEEVEMNNTVIENDEDTFATEGEHTGNYDFEKHGAHKDETDSISTEDSFVLLSELEKENTVSDNTNSPYESVTNKEVDDLGNKTSKSNEDDLKENDSKAQGNQQTVKSDNLDDKTETKYPQSSRSSNDNDTILFRLEMPSYNPESMKVTFDNTKSLLSISASKEQSSPGTKTSGAENTITKSVAVGKDVDVDKLQCYFRDGTLTVTAPQKMTVKTIPINSL